MSFVILKFTFVMLMLYLILFFVTFARGDVTETLKFPVAIFYFADIKKACHMSEYFSHKATYVRLYNSIFKKTQMYFANASRTILRDFILFSYIFSTRYPFRGTKDLLLSMNTGVLVVAIMEDLSLNVETGMRVRYTGSHGCEWVPVYVRARVQIRFAH